MKKFFLTCLFFLSVFFTIHLQPQEFKTAATMFEQPVNLTDNKKSVFYEARGRDEKIKTARAFQGNHSETNKSFHFTLSLSASGYYPMGFVSDFWRSGAAYELNLGFKFIPSLQAEINTGRCQLSNHQGVVSEKYDFYFSPVMVNLKYYFINKTFSPYIKAGVGLTYWRVVESPDKGTDFSYRIGAGLDNYVFESFYLNIEGSFYSFQIKNEKGRFVNIGAGLGYRF